MDKKQDPMQMVLDALLELGQQIIELREKKAAQEKENCGEGEAMRGKARQCMARRGLARSGKARYGKVW